MAAEPDETAEPDYLALNREFYSAEPSSYFRDRLRLLAIRTAREADLINLIGEGLEWGPVRVLNAETDNLDLNPEDAARYSLIESQVLLHHTAETLIRLFLAHAELDPCPWMAMTALRNFEVFNNHVEEIASPTWSPELQQSVLNLFVGADLMRLAPEDEEEARRICERILRYLAGVVRDDKGIYNAAKHGLGIPVGPRTLQLSTDDGRPVIGSSGYAISHLERERKKDGSAVWHHSTKWVDPEQAAVLTECAAIQMEALWTVARLRYLRQKPAGIYLTNEAILDAALTGMVTAGISSFRRVVAYEPPPPPKPKPQRQNR